MSINWNQLKTKVIDTVNDIRNKDVVKDNKLVLTLVTILILSETVLSFALWNEIKISNAIRALLLIVVFFSYIGATVLAIVATIYNKETENKARRQYKNERRYGKTFNLDAPKLATIGFLITIGLGKGFIGAIVYVTILVIFFTNITFQRH